MEEYRASGVLTRLIRVGAVVIVASPIVALLFGAEGWDILRSLVLGATAVIMAGVAASLYDTLRRLRTLHYPSNSMKEMDQGRRDRAIFFLLALGDEAYQVIHRIGNPHLNIRTPFMIVLLWLAMSTLLKIDVKRWRALP
jgi:hypothetical protein